MSLSKPNRPAESRSATTSDDFADSLSDDHRVLLELLAKRSRDNLSTQFGQLAAHDWERVVAAAEQLDLAPLLYARLKAHPVADALTKSTMIRLQTSYLQTAARNLRLFADLAQVLEELRRNNIPVIVLKGVYLAQIVYESAGVRPMADVDFLVHVHDIPQVEQLILGLGYSTDVKNKTEHAKICAHNVYNLPEHGLSLEVHWGIEGDPTPFSIDTEGLWKRSEPAAIAGVPVLSLSPEDLILHLCLHVSFHHLFKVAGLRSLCDIAESIRHFDGRLDWGIVCNRAQAWGAQNSVYLTLYVAKRLLKAPVPDLALRDLEPSDFDKRMATWAEERILSAGRGASWTESDNWGRLRASTRVRDRMAVLLRTLFPSRQLLAQMYALPATSRRVLLYYPVRQVELVRRHYGRIWLVLRRDARARAWAAREAGRVEETAIKRALLWNDHEMRSWIEQDDDRAANLTVVEWLASA